MNRIMLDLETMGTGTTAAITSIGAVRFGNGSVPYRFEVIVDLQSSMDAGLKIDADTIMWWLQQSEEARSGFAAKGMSLAGALLKFSEWVEGSKVPNLEDEMWGNGAAFDNAILSNAYRACGVSQPWKFWNDRCYRTIKSTFRGVPINRVGTLHCAVDDAETQARHLMDIEDIYNFYGITRSVEELL